MIALPLRVIRDDAVAKPACPGGDLRLEFAACVSTAEFSCPNDVHESNFEMFLP